MEKKEQSPKESYNNKFQFQEDIKHPNTEKNSKKEKNKKESKEILINNLKSHNTPTSDRPKEMKSLLNVKDKNIQKDCKNYYNNDKQDIKFEIIKKDPIITQVTLTKFYPKKNLKKGIINESEIKKHDIDIDSIRNRNKNKYATEKNSKKNSNINNEVNNNNKYEKLLKKYENLIKDIQNKEKTENEEMNLKYNYEGYFNDIKQTNKNEETKSDISHNNKQKINIKKEQSNPNNKEHHLNEELSHIYKKGYEEYLKNIENPEDQDYSHLKQQNELFNKEIKRLQEYIKEQERYVQNYKNKQKINEEQIKYLSTLKESNIISHKEKDALIEEMKNKIFCLQKENNDLKEEIKSLNKIIELNKKEKNNDKFEKNNNEKILKEIKNLKKLLSEKNDIIQTLQNCNNTDEENNELKKRNTEFKEEINKLKKELKIKDNELNNMKNKNVKMYENLNKIKNDYQNLYQKYIEQNNIVDQYLKTNTIDATGSIYNNKESKNTIISNSSSNIDHINRTIKLLNKNKNKKYIRNNNYNYNERKKNKSYDNLRTFFVYRNEEDNLNNMNLIKTDLRINANINADINDDINKYNNNKFHNNKNMYEYERKENKCLFYTPNRLNIKYNQNNSFDYNNTNYFNNYTSNYFYNKKNNLLESNDFTDNNMNSLKKNNNKNLSELILSEKALNEYPNIYTLVGAKIIGFNLLKKKFILIKPIDKTSNLFNENVNTLRNYNILPITLNNTYGFFILLINYIFFYCPLDNTLNTLVILNKNHLNGGFASVQNDLYIISGIDTTECELYSFESKKICNLPRVNYKRVNSSICNVNNQFIYALFGRNSDNTIERLNIKNKGDSESWELIRLKNELTINNLQQFLSFHNNDDSIIILGGDDCLNNENHEILKLDINDNCLKNIGYINLKSSYLNQITFIDEEYFAIYDIINGLHFFNKDLEQHVIFNFQV